ncbi:MAG: NADP-dependent oxidoreductase [Bacteroidota bacterium]|nr:NADP-dependent oxidoreductase [Candidatus Kapabacteria bacterium]MDW8219221.1 NADP-dependent oxidoreductase [Bacteroidota bacterium]
MPTITNTCIRLISRAVGLPDASVWKVCTQPLPALEDSQFLVRVHYISIDPAMRGWMNEGSTYIQGVQLGDVMRAFAAGEVIDSKNPAFPIGTYVTGLLGVQTYACSDGQNVERVPASSPNELPRYLGVLGMPGMTAYWGLLDKGCPRAGETVLVSGAAGTVGSLVGQIAKLHGCTVIGIAGGTKKCDYLRHTLGFDAALDYTQGSLSARIRSAAPQGVNIYFDNVGGDVLDAALENLARGARVVICGAISQYNNTTPDGKPAPPQGPTNYMKIVTARGQMNGIIVFDYFHRTQEFRSHMQRWIAEGKITLHEHILEGIESFPHALTMLFRGENIGKILVRVTSPSVPSA